ncbi:hypothetical protein SARC_10723 [Sphaeroforma arctica JP610]|uniref:C2H2-type domain-containing protein n=1 Tax=Sphaeroforma arctica JP610 TaxID=667725 RepID=A0A0L0FJ44_9EUKA|nr:hypothetical protein SARC_10723 [Sphaeroforma arctica JP610]KNC76797.1 hypothetical protein SARC_10723 [Sphaeroforma arctica JP610]|eukprot:XP_014150699.1 hypothetical protein SARC_10723 [Sphaeroforma arctica JP610]
MTTSNILASTFSMKGKGTLECIDEQTLIAFSTDKASRTKGAQIRQNIGNTKHKHPNTKNRPFLCQFNCCNTYKSEDTRRRHYRRSHNQEWVLAKRSRQNTLRKQNSLKAAFAASLQHSDSVPIPQEQMVSIDSMRSNIPLPNNSTVQTRVYGSTHSRPYERSMSSTSTHSTSSTASSNVYFSFQATQHDGEATMSSRLSQSSGAWVKPIQFGPLTQSADIQQPSDPISPCGGGEMFAQQVSQDLFGAMSSVVGQDYSAPALYTQNNPLSQSFDPNVTHDFVLHAPVAPVSTTNSIAEFEHFLRQLETYSQ